MASDIDDADDQRLSRRSALKGLGAAGTAAVAWTAPTILSSPAASAATIVPHPCADGDCGPDDCDDQNGCGDDSTTGLPCTCKQNVGPEVGCTCTQNVPCAGLVPCSVQSPCPEGFICQIGCCGEPLCFPLCA